MPSGGGGGGGDSGSPADMACSQASDCGFGEIDHEILEKSDCLCLLGCAGYPLNIQTIARRAAQYTSLCDFSMDGSGRPCPIDECIRPPPALCNNGVCAAPQ
jgi:hypothetical protein